MQLDYMRVQEVIYVEHHSAAQLPIEMNGNSSMSCYIMMAG